MNETIYYTKISNTGILRTKLMRIMVQPGSIVHEHIPDRQ